MGLAEVIPGFCPDLTGSNGCGCMVRCWSSAHNLDIRSRGNDRHSHEPFDLPRATLAGIPVSTTHTITGAIIGVGATRRLSAVKWGVARRIVWAWILTIPMAGGFAGLSFLLIKAVHSLAT
jgi:hypothetical protein